MADLLTIAQLESDMEFNHVQDLRTAIILGGGDLDAYQEALIQRSRGRVKEDFKQLTDKIKTLVATVEVSQSDNNLWDWHAGDRCSSDASFDSEDKAWKDFAEFLLKEIHGL